MESLSTDTSPNTSHRLAAIFMVINSLFLLTGVVLNIEDPSRIPMLISSATVDIIIAIFIFRGNRGALLWARIRILLGLVVFSVSSLMNADVWTLVLQALLSASLLLLLLGDAGSTRRLVAAILFTILAILNIVGLVYLLALPNTLAAEYELMEIGELRDLGHIGEGPLPELPEEWKIRNPESYALENPGVGLWFVNPLKDSHIMVISEALPGNLEIEHGYFVDVVKANAGAVGEITVVSENHEQLAGFERTILHTSAVIDGQSFSYLYGISSNSETVLQIICFSLTGVFDSQRPQFENFIRDYSLTVAP